MQGLETVTLILLLVSVTTMFLSFTLIFVRIKRSLPKLGSNIKARIQRQQKVFIKILQVPPPPKKRRQLLLIRFAMAVYPNEATPYQITRRMIIHSSRLATLQSGQLVWANYDPTHLERVEFDFKQDPTEEEKRQMEVAIAHIHAPLRQVKVPISGFNWLIGTLLFITVTGIAVGMILAIIGLIILR